MGIAITKIKHTNHDSQDNSTIKGDVIPAVRKESIYEHKFSFENAMEFRCITQAELDILNWEQQQNIRCAKTGLQQLLCMFLSNAYKTEYEC